MNDKTHYIISIDDDDDFNNYLKLVLKKINIKSSITKTPETFIEKLNKQTPDLCLIDLNLDIASGAGYQIIKAIRNIKGKEIPIFVLSRRKSDEDTVMAFELGADDFISKPLDEYTFKAKLEKFLNISNLIEPLPLYSISEKNSLCEFKIFFTLLEIQEDFFVLESPNYIEKGQVFYLEGSILQEIFDTDEPSIFTISEFERDPITNNYIYQAKFDYNNDHIRYASRKWLLLNSI